MNKTALKAHLNNCLATEERLEKELERAHAETLQTRRMLCPVKDGMIMVDKNGRRAKVTSVHFRYDDEPNYKGKVWKKTTGDWSDHEIKLYSWDAWKLEPPAA